MGWDDISYYQDVNGICIKNLATGKISWVTRSLEMHTPAWSPDSKSLTWRKGCKSYVVWNITTNLNFEVTVPDGCLHPSPTSLTWSLNGQRIFIQGSYFGIDVLTEDLLPLADDSYYVFSSSGKYLASLYRNADEPYGPNHLIVKEIGTKNIVFEPEQTASSLSDFQWSPDGNMLGWLPSDCLGFTLTIVASWETVCLPDSDWGFRDLGPWSPSGNGIATVYQPSDSDSYNSYELRVFWIACTPTPFECQTLEKKAFPMRGSSPGHLTWSPDGKRIAYETNYQYGEIWIIDLETGQEQPLIER